MSDPPSADAHEYLLGTDAAERVRLGFQHQVWMEETARVWERAAFRPGHTLLDVGCGPGYGTLDLARRVGREGTVVGIDLSQRFLDHLRAQSLANGLENIETVHADVERLALPEASADGAFARWVLCFAADPEAVVRGVARALRPGGSFAILDYCHYLAFTLAPPSEAVDRVLRATAASFRTRGGNADIGRELPGILQRCGLEVTHLAPVVRAARPGSALWRWIETFFEGYVSTLIDLGLLTAPEGEAFEAAWRQRSADPAAFFFSPLMIELVAIKR